MKTRILSMMLALLMCVTAVLSLTACKDDADVKKPTETTATQATEKATEAQTEAQTETQTQEATQATEKATEAATEAQNSNDEVVMPDIKGIWAHENNPKNCTVEITDQDGNNVDFIITSVKGNAAQVATSNVYVTLETEYDGSIIRGYADFNYTDSFGTGGTGSISVTENVITLVINQEFNDGGTWSVANATGNYYEK